MLPLLTSPLARYAAVALLLAGVGGWGWLERAGRISADLRAQAAEREAAGLRVTIQHMETRNAIDRDIARERDPAGRLRERWSRPD